MIAAEFKRTSLNKNLMSGPDLANQIVGVITRFREERVAVISDTEYMFRQVLVREKDRSLLRFLWWENHDTRSQMLDFGMNVGMRLCQMTTSKIGISGKENYSCWKDWK